MDPQSNELQSRHGASVAVIGGGLAGLSAACALSDAGFRVTLFERKPYLGGRASSYEHPGTGEVVDNCQHVLLGCCTNLLDFYRRIGSEEKIHWFDRLTFVEPGGRQSQIAPGVLPAPMHASISFLNSAALGLADKLAIARGMVSLMGELPADDPEKSFADWLREHGQTEQAISRFWEVVLVSAINESLDRISVRYGAQVFRESFLKSADAGRMGVPLVPLTELYANARTYIEQHGGEVRLRANVDAFSADESGITVSSAGELRRFDYGIVAVPQNVLPKLLPTTNGTAAPADELARKLTQFESSPITGIHLWFDRLITDLPHAVLLDRTIQWMFHKSQLQRDYRGASAVESSGSYVELVVSASRNLVEMGRQEIIDLAVRELGEFFSAVGEAKLLKATVVKELHATYSAKPGSDAYRPQTESPWPGVFLAGDWTSTGWPATMEGAVRSGYNAAEALARAAGKPKKFRVPDLPARGLMRLFG